MKLERQGQTYQVFLQDDGTLDTVVSVNGRVFRFDSESRSENSEEDREAIHTLFLEAIDAYEEKRTLEQLLTVEDVPSDFPVKPLKTGETAKDKMTCGTCGLSWDDAIGTSWTPVPSARCPFEYFHKSEA